MERLEEGSFLFNRRTIGNLLEYYEKCFRSNRKKKNNDHQKEAKKKIMNQASCGSNSTRGFNYLHLRMTSPLRDYSWKNRYHEDQDGTEGPDA